MLKVQANHPPHLCSDIPTSTTMCLQVRTGQQNQEASVGKNFSRIFDFGILIVVNSNMKPTAY
jgi:hypothetical protein